MGIDLSDYTLFLSADTSTSRRFLVEYARTEKCFEEGGAADGAVITNANDVTVNVELGSSWVGGVAPGASDTAVFEAVNTTTRFKAGTDLSWYGMEWRHPTITAATPGIGISAATGSETLTVGAEAVRGSTSTCRSS